MINSDIPAVKNCITDHKNDIERIIIDELRKIQRQLIHNVTEMNNEHFKVMARQIMADNPSYFDSGDFRDAIFDFDAGKAEKIPYREFNFRDIER